jgi:hypothetical protein
MPDGGLPTNILIAKPKKGVDGTTPRKARVRTLSSANAAKWESEQSGGALGA